MKVLVLGAGALGGYFGGRLAEAGRDVTFLVRARRAETLRRDGLRIESPFGDATLPVAVATAAEAGFGLVLLSCKAYDLDDAIAAIRPAVEGGAVVLPVLNGLSHIETLRRAFGPGAVLGGLAKIQANLAADGTVRQFNDWRWITFGELDGRASPRSEAVARLFDGAVGVEAKAVPDIAQRMWEKLVHLGTSAIGTVLMRANVGEIVRAGGRDLLLTVLQRNAAVAAAHGHPMPESFLAEYRSIFSDAGSGYSTSLLRDIELGNRTEGEHILGYLAEAAHRAGVDATLHDLARLHAASYDQRRAANRLP
ncbi:MAG: ketopantoate reductase family protein [Acetobacteraceae bacterium]|nr:ketopantoate reductase family protein [Acetobacteraceae bacterium]